MTRNSTLARRYAVALGELAQEQGVLAQVEQDMAAIRALCASGGLLNLLTDEKSSKEMKEQAMQQLFAGRAHELTLRFLLLVTRKGRAAHLPAMADELQAYADKARHEVAAHVTTAAPLDEELRESLRRSLSAIAGCGVRLVEEVDPQLIGGVKARIGDKVIDGSVYGRLRRLHAAMKDSRHARNTAEA